MSNFNIKLFDQIIHLPNKIFFPLFKKENKINSKFKEFGFIHYKQTLENKKFAEEINEVFKNFNKKEIIEEKIKKDPKSYSLSIAEYLNEDLKIKITNFFNNPKHIHHVSSMLGYRVKFRKFTLMMNFYNDQNKESMGAQMFHRDSDSLQDQVKIFMLIHDIENDNGMFYFVPKNFINENYKLPFELNRLDMELQNKWRNYDETVLFYIKNKNKDESPIKKLQGLQGEMLYMDTGKVYHKGGYILEPHKERFLLQAIYTPILSLSDWNNSKNFLSIFLKNKLTTLRIKLRTVLKT